MVSWIASKARLAMNRLVLLVSVFILASSCRPLAAESGACRASLDALNKTGVEQVVFARDVSGHDGYSLIAPDCDFFVPFSIARVPEAERVQLNLEVRSLIEQNSETRGVGFFEANCDCSYDAHSTVVNASSVTDLALYRGPELMGRGER